MTTIPVAAIQFAPRSVDSEANLVRMSQLVRAAADRGARLVVFPELSDAGYIRWPTSRAALMDTSRYAEAARPIPGPSTEVLSAVSRETGTWIVAGLLEADPEVKGVIANTAVLIDPHRGLVGKQRKVHLSLAEALYFEPGRHMRVFKTELGRIGIAICYDSFFPEHARALALRGMDLYCIAWNTAVPHLLGGEAGGSIPIGYQADIVRAVPVVRAFENTVYVVSAGRTGYDTFTRAKFMGLSQVVAPCGTTLAQAGASGEEIVIADIDLTLIARLRAYRPLLRDRRPAAYGTVTLVGSPASAAGHRTRDRASERMGQIRAEEEADEEVVERTADEPSS